MPLANKNTRRTSDFQGLVRAQPKRDSQGLMPQGSAAKKKLSVKAPTNAKDVSTLLKMLREKSGGKK